MADPYSPLLGVAIAGIVAALVLRIAGRHVAAARHGAQCLGLAVLAVTAVTLALHARLGHGHNSRHPMALADLVAEHPAPVAVTLIAIAVVAWR